jgi:hypothetical protein
MIALGSACMPWNVSNIVPYMLDEISKILFFYCSK